MFVMRISFPSSLVNLRIWSSFKTVSSMAEGVLATAHREDLWLAKENPKGVKGGKSRSGRERKAPTRERKKKNAAYKCFNH